MINDVWLNDLMDGVFDDYVIYDLLMVGWWSVGGWWLVDDLGDWRFIAGEW